MSFFAKLFGLNQKATVSKDVVTQATQESSLFNQPSFSELIKKTSFYLFDREKLTTYSFGD